MEFLLFLMFIVAPMETKWKSWKSLSGFTWGSDSGSWIRLLFPVLKKPPSFFGPWPDTGRVTVLCSSYVFRVNGAPLELLPMVALSWAWTSVPIFYPMVIVKKKNLRVFKKVWYYLCHRPNWHFGLNQCGLVITIQVVLLMVKHTCWKHELAVTFSQARSDFFIKYAVPVLNLVLSKSVFCWIYIVVMHNDL